MDFVVNFAKVNLPFFFFTLKGNSQYKSFAVCQEDGFISIDRVIDSFDSLVGSDSSLGCNWNASDAGNAITSIDWSLDDELLVRAFLFFDLKPSILVFYFLLFFFFHC